MIELNYDQAVRELQRAVKERGEMYVYPDSHRDGAGLCQYVHGNDPSCIVGKVFHQVGADIKLLAGRVVGVDGAAEAVGVQCDSATLELLSYAQTFQDKGHTWGQSVGAAMMVNQGTANLPC